MTNQFSPKVSEVLSYSREEALRLSSAHICPEHFLLGMMREKQNPLTDLLNTLDIDGLTVKQELEAQVCSHGCQDASSAVGSPTLSEQASNLLKLSVLEARLQRAQRVSMQHLILAILHDKVANGAKQVLEERGINYANSMKFFKSSDNLESSPEGIRSVADNKMSADNAPMVRSGVGISDGDTAEPHSQFGGKQGAEGSTTQQRQKGGDTSTPVLDKFATDLTEAASAGMLDPVVGREKEIARVSEILCRRKKNNPILIGEPGVGKSAIAEGLAQLIARRRTSPLLFGKRIMRLDMTSVVAGTKYRGQFEERIQALLRELEGNPNIVLFIDEIHTIVGAGSTAGSMDAANIMKPALARGKIQCIGATTLDEYRNSIEKDGALERRFQRVMIEPPTEDQTLAILNNIKERYEDHHHVTYTDEAIAACVQLTSRYITGRQLPDKAIDALDEVGAHIHLLHANIPPEIADKERMIAEIKQLKKAAVEDQNFELAASYRDRQCQLEAELKSLSEKWLSGDDGRRETVTATDVAAVVSRMAGIPLQRVTQSEGALLRGLGSALKASVVAQEQAIDKIVRSIQRNRLGLKDPSHPIGVFMFLGPTGVGKTYLTQRLAELMFGSKDSLIRIDMSEYSEKFNTSRLVGAPPGYVGYGEGGQLTEKVRRHPYSIVLLDEIEKAHGDVFNLLLQVLDEGRMTDGNGRMVDFRNTIIIMTSNAGTRQLKDFSHGIGFGAVSLDGAADEKSKEYARSVIQKSLSRQFAPEFLNRLDEIIMFDQLDATAIRHIVDIEVDRLQNRLANAGYKINVTDSAKNFLASKGYDPQFGARPLKRAMQTYIEDEMCEFLLSDQAEVDTHLEFDYEEGKGKLTLRRMSDMQGQ